jgi:hypothetical protein
MPWGEDQWKGKSLRSTFCRIAIWQQRNDVLHQRKINSEKIILRKIRWEVKGREESRGNLCNSVLTDHCAVYEAFLFLFTGTGCLCLLYLIE